MRVKASFPVSQAKVGQVLKSAKHAMMKVEQSRLATVIKDDRGNGDYSLKVFYHKAAIESFWPWNFSRFGQGSQETKLQGVEATYF